VCAAVTGAVRLLDCILRDQMGLKIVADVEPETARISFVLNASEAGGSSVQAVLAGFERYIEEIAREYPGHVQITEGKE
jgi:uncharacterized protein YsxB (DUF464 family)